MKRIIIFLFYLCLISQINAQKIPTIDRSRFEVSSKSANFGESGGTKTFTVTADKSWSIKSYPASWAKIALNGKQIVLTVEGNNSSESRNTSFSITSTGRTIAIHVSQEAMTLLEISSSSADFSSSGGTKTFTVSSSSSWDIGIQTNSWGHLTRNGNTLTLRVEANQQKEERGDYFTIVSGGKSARVDITQSGVSSIFSISSNRADFSSSGGTKTFTVSSSSSWIIETTTDYWGHLARSGNTLTLKVDASKQEEKRKDYFIIASGGKRLRVDITQSGISPVFTISSNSANFASAGGVQTFTVESSSPWEIGTSTDSWGQLTRNGNTLTLRVDVNKQTSSREDYFTITSGEKKLRVDIAQSAAEPYLSVNEESEKLSVDFGQYGGREKIQVNTNLSDFETLYEPYFCYIANKTATGFELGCFSNSSSYSRSGYMKVKAGDKEVRINISQSPNYRKWKRRNNGGWVNMAIGLEGGYNENLWYANGLLGLRIGNYKDIVQFEVGISPGVFSSYSGYEDMYVTGFHLPVYSSLKISASSGKFYLKLGGAYNLLRDDEYEGEYSLRAGFGSAWKHFEWDWLFVQFNDPSEYIEAGKYETGDMFDESNIQVGMRMAWYLTR